MSTPGGWGWSAQEAATPGECNVARVQVRHHPHLRPPRADGRPLHRRFTRVSLEPSTSSLSSRTHV